MKKIISIFISLAILVSLAACGNTRQPAEISAEVNLVELGEQYLPPAFYSFVTFSSWENASEIDADNLVEFYSWAAYLESLDIIIPDNLIQNNGYTNLLPAEVIEQAIQRHFSITAEHLRTSMYYHADSDSYEVVGLGGASSYEILNVTLSDGIVEIEFNGLQDGDLFQTGKLSIKQNGEAYQYISCHAERI